MMFGAIWDESLDVVSGLAVKEKAGHSAGVTSVHAVADV